MIFIHEFKNGQRLFHIQTMSTSYVIMVHNTGHLIQLHYGKRVEDSEHLVELYQNYATELGSSTLYDTSNKLTLDTVMLEIPTFGKGDYRTPSIELEFNDGSRVSDFTYLNHEIHFTKEHPDGMPHIIEAESPLESLEVSLYDRVKNFEVKLFYTPVPSLDIIVRRVKLINHSGETVIIHKAHSFNLDLNHSRFKLMTLDGLWIRERQINKGPLRPGTISIDSKKGVSGANHNPFIGLLGPGTNENSGECYGFSLVYSGNFSGNVEVSPYGMTRIQMGISDFDFRWKLETGASFDTPEIAMTYSKDGINRMSQNFHNVINKHLIGKKWQNTPRPVLINNWEATYFDFNMSKLVKLAKVAKEVGVELFVLDDGWFKDRYDDKSSLGDWTYDTKKLPGGLKALSNRLKGIGLEFGIWVEPEMVSINSDLYRAHPEWAIQLKDRTPSLGRNQLVLDMTNPEVVDYLFESLVSVFDSADITYVKWDMNRNFSDLYSNYLDVDQQSEISHRYVLGLYELLERLTKTFPDILFESCSSGGNRFDMGMLYYMPQTWTSDNTDAVERYEIQYGTSIVYPQSTMGAHVSGRPSHQVLRSTPIETRFNVSAFGVLGYELDLTRLSTFDLKVIKKQIEFYKMHRTLFQFGTFYRHESPFEGNCMSWSVVSEDQDKFIAGYYQKLQKPNPPLETLELDGLHRNKVYAVQSRIQYQNVRDYGELINPYIPVKIKDGGIMQSVIGNRYLYKLEVQRATLPGDVLMNIGLRMYSQFSGTGIDDKTRNMGDFGSRLYIGVSLNQKNQC